MLVRGRSPLLIASLVALVGAACGTPSTSSGGASSPGGKGNDPPPQGTTKEGGQPPTEATGPQKPSCTDGSCFECGEGICPAGFYCQKSGGATGCAWAAECAQKPSCACLAPHTSGCSCEERGGFPHVTCGS